MMSVSQSEIEFIVRRVLSTLIDGDMRQGLELIDGNPIREDHVLSISDALVTLESVNKRLHGIKTLEILPKAVITPAVVDACRSASIKIVRKDLSRIPPQERKSDWGPKLIVSGASPILSAVAKQLCPKQAEVVTCSDDTSTLTQISVGIRAGQKAGIAIVNAPHATCWQAARDERLRPAVVTQWTELDSVLVEVPVNLLILSANRWNVPSVCNVARRFHTHLKKHS